MNIRKEIRALTATEQLECINTLLAMKRSGVYDKYVHWHHAVMKATVNCDTGMPSSPSAESSPRPTARLMPITSSGNSAVNTDR